MVPIRPNELPIYDFLLVSNSNHMSVTWSCYRHLIIPPSFISGPKFWTTHTHPCRRAIFLIIFFLCQREPAAIKEVDWLRTILRYLIYRRMDAQTQSNKAGQAKLGRGLIRRKKISLLQNKVSSFSCWSAR